MCGGRLVSAISGDKEKRKSRLVEEKEEAHWYDTAHSGST